MTEGDREFYGGWIIANAAVAGMIVYGNAGDAFGMALGLGILVLANAAIIGLAG